VGVGPMQVFVELVWGGAGLEEVDGLLAQAKLLESRKEVLYFNHTHTIKYISKYNPYRHTQNQRHRNIGIVYIPSE
jgi:hypothetical protein